MFLLKILICVFTLAGNETFAFVGRRCHDCVSLVSCQPGLNFARKISQGSLSTKTFTDAICGTDGNNPAIPKVCCSDFCVPTPRGTSLDPIETHPNIGLLPSSCGHIDGSRNVSATLPNLYEFPWMALIGYNITNELQYRCTGAIINSRYILVAAHCVTNGSKMKRITGVRIGEFDLSTDVDCHGDYINRNMICESKIQDIDVEEIISHPSFTGHPPTEANIALLRLKENINMTNNAAPICLPVHSDLLNSRLTGLTATISVWADRITEYTNELTTPVKAAIPILPVDSCSIYYERSVDNSIICAGPRKDSGFGDIGGPLMVESCFNGEVRLVQFGIASFGPLKDDKPIVYTDVTKYMSWILNNIRA